MGAITLAGIVKAVTGVATVVEAASTVKDIIDKPEAPPAVTPAPTIEEPVKEEKKPVTEAPEVAAGIAKEEEKKRRRKRQTTKTLLTGSRGVLAPADVQKKVLLGE